MKTRIEALINWGMATFDKVQAQAFKLPFVRIDKAQYLTKTLKGHCTEKELEQAISTSPVDVLGLEEVRKLSKKCIWKHAIATSLFSAIAVAPSNTYLQWALLVCDLIQFQIMVYIVAQKLMYLYGHKLKEGDKEGSTKAAVVIATVSAIMIGTHRISQTMKSAVGATARRAVLQISARAGNRIIAVKFVQQTLKWCGIEVTKNTLMISLEFFVNALCISISGLVSFWLIYPMCKRLVKHLEEDLNEPQATPEEQNSSDPLAE